MLEPGQLTPWRFWLVPEAWACHEPPVLVIVKPCTPTATQLELLGQLIPVRGRVVPDVSDVHVLPSLVEMTVPDVPTATHVVGLAQLMPRRNTFVPRTGFAWIDQLVPLSVVT
jgi:hypothetical protein